MCGYEKPNYLIFYLALFRFVATVEFINLVSLTLPDVNGLNDTEGWGRSKKKYRGGDCWRIMFFIVGPFP